MSVDTLSAPQQAPSGAADVDEPRTAEDLLAGGLRTIEGKGISGHLVYERPAYVFDPRRMKNCELGAFSYINGYYTSSLYGCRIGRYCSIAEAVVVGAPEHPVDQFTTHPFSFTRRAHLPQFYDLEEFVRLAPDEDAPLSFVMPQTTTIGHDVWIGAGAFVKRGVTIGDGAVIAAHAVVTHDVPPYAIVVGTPAKVLRLRAPEPLVERLLKLQWWRYDLAPHKRELDFRSLERSTATLETLLAAGRLQTLRPPTFRLTRAAGRFSRVPLPNPLY